MNSQSVRAPLTLLDRLGLALAAADGIVSVLSIVDASFIQIARACSLTTVAIIVLIAVPPVFDKARMHRFHAVSRELNRQRIEWDGEWGFFGERTGSPVGILLRNGLMLQLVGLFLWAPNELAAIEVTTAGCFATFAVSIRQATPTNYNPDEQF